MFSECELVIFDCDGVLVDSEPISLSTLVKNLQRIGVRCTMEEARELFLGRSMAAVVAAVEERFGVVPPPGFEADHSAELLRVLGREVQPVPGVAEILDEISLPFCVASSGSTDKMRTTLGATGLLPRFEGRLFSAESVERGKPAPDLMLYAARRMGVDPARCVAVDDSPAGIGAARAAGMGAIGFARETAAEILLEAGAQSVIHRFEPGAIPGVA